MLRKVFGCSAVSWPRLRNKDFNRKSCSLLTSIINSVCYSRPKLQVLPFPEVFNMLWLLAGKPRAPTRILTLYGGKPKWCNNHWLSTPSQLWLPGQLSHNHKLLWSRKRSLTSGAEKKQQQAFGFVGMWPADKTLCKGLKTAKLRLSVHLKFRQCVAKALGWNCTILASGTVSSAVNLQLSRWYPHEQEMRL